MSESRNPDGCERGPGADPWDLPVAAERSAGGPLLPRLSTAMAALAWAVFHGPAAWAPEAGLALAQLVLEASGGAEEQTPARAPAPGAARDFADALAEIAALSDRELLEHGRESARAILARHAGYASCDDRR